MSWDKKENLFVCVLDSKNSNLCEFITYIEDVIEQKNIESLNVPNDIDGIIQENIESLEFPNAVKVEHYPDPMKGSYKCVYTYRGGNGKCYIVANQKLKKNINIYEQLIDIEREISITNKLHKKIGDIVPYFYTYNLYIDEIKTDELCNINLDLGVQFISNKVDVGGIKFMQEYNVYIYYNGLQLNGNFNGNNDEFQKLLNYYTLYTELTSKTKGKPFVDKISVFNCLELKPDSNGFSQILYDSMKKNEKVFSPLFKALKKIHDCGFIHRDIKDDNFAIDIDNGIVRIIDFGLAIEKERFQKELNDTTDVLLENESKFAKKFPELFDEIQSSVTKLPAGYENHPMMMEFYRIEYGFWVYSLFRTNLLFGSIETDAIFDMNSIIFWYDNNYKKTILGDVEIERRIREGFPIAKEIRECIFKTICEYYDEVNKEL